MAKKIIYWVATLWLALGMSVTGSVQVLHLKEKAPFMQNLGYPDYFLTIIGVLLFVYGLSIQFPLLTW